ncbi:torsin interacting protein isoform X1 [Bombus vancouverensis nearcticus]|uniref:torsin interacting protein isoform X1 n=1 Tax=Bombus vancouverensis nearcticus TaxID=2705178 RepID=UPI00402B2C18
MNMYVFIVVNKFCASNGPNDQIEISKPPVPKARRSIRNTDVQVIEEIDSFKDSKNSLAMKNIYRTNQQGSEICNISDIQYTDDEDDDEKDDDSDEDNSNYNISKWCLNVNTSRDSVLQESFHTPCNSPIGSQMHKRSSHNPHGNQSSNINSSFSCKPQKQPADGSFPKYTTFFFCVTILCLTLFLIYTSTKTHENLKGATEAKQTDFTDINNLLHKSIQLIQTRFHNQRSNIWNDISAGIYDVILSPTKPSIIILFGNETKTLNCLAQLLGQLSAKILGNNDYLRLTPKDFPNDVGQVIYNLRKRITQKKVIIIQDLLSINTEALKAFHNFCDREKPLVENVIYIITVTVDGYKSSQRELEFIENQIFKRLSNYMHKDILDPLVTRLTDGIIVPILPETNTNFNYADCSFSINNKL